MMLVMVYIKLLALFLLGTLLCTICDNSYHVDVLNLNPEMATYSIESISEFKGIKVVHVNVRSLLQHFDDIVINLLNGVFDIVVLSESWKLCRQLSCSLRL